MAEGTTRKVHFPQLGMEDFERLCEFAYSGDYTVPKPAVFHHKCEENWDIGKKKHVDAPDVFADTLFPTDKDNMEDFNRYCSQPDRETSTPCKDVFCGRNLRWEDDFGPVFLGHARLYAFAHMYMIPRLQTAALRKLHCTLKRFSLYSSSYASIVELVRFVYAEDLLPNRKVVPGEHPACAMNKRDPLRELVVDFVVLYGMYFEESPEHRELLEEGGEYPAHLMHTMVESQYG
jgi:hypothetical protein